MTDAPPPTAAAPLSPHSGRRLLVLLIGLFALPFAVGGGLYALQWRPAAGGNFGELVADAPALPLSQLVGDTGRPAEALTGRWTLAVLAADCAERCRAQLDQLRRLHVALGKNMPRVRRLLLTVDGPTSGTPALRSAWPDLVIARTDAPWWRAERAALGADQTRVFVLDPEARPVLRYAVDLDDLAARRALRDVERLLKLSWIG